MMNDGVSHERSPKELKGIHVLMWLMGFFGLMFAVNGVFLFHAITSFPGEDIQKSYLQGINYNDKLKDRALQMDRGWTAQMGLESRKLIVHLEDRHGQPLNGYEVTVELRRLATTAEDRLLVLKSTGAGNYEMSIGSLSMGQWEAVATVSDETEQQHLFTAHKTLTVK
ncbi:MAG: hypothetical protein CME88_17420 [Hirschia sp.]|nr:hypothetical protein [Hirschia sp.]MBF20154.1 hypothetical protein [Hirschia sp.]|tara:strand:+ start:63 stop:566 length:504 start_codon:yes stop_codon:yes gene_type:complete